jgi:hypothetical protein
MLENARVVKISTALTVITVTSLELEERDHLICHVLQYSLVDLYHYPVPPQGSSFMATLSSSNRCNRTYHILNAWRPSMRNSCSFAMFFSSISLHCLIFAGASASCDRTELLQHVTRQGGSQRPPISRSKSLVQRVTGGHSKHRRPPTNRTEAGLREVAEYLRRAKGECLRSSVECLPALKQVGGQDMPRSFKLIRGSRVQ